MIHGDFISLGSTNNGREWVTHQHSSSCYRAVTTHIYQVIYKLLAVANIAQTTMYYNRKYPHVCTGSERGRTFRSQKAAGPERPFVMTNQRRQEETGPGAVITVVTPKQTTMRSLVCGPSQPEPVLSRQTRRQCFVTSRGHTINSWTSANNIYSGSILASGHYTLLTRIDFLTRDG